MHPGVEWGGPGVPEPGAQEGHAAPRLLQLRGLLSLCRALAAPSGDSQLWNSWSQPPWGGVSCPPPASPTGSSPACPWPPWACGALRLQWWVGEKETLGFGRVMFQQTLVGGTVGQGGGRSGLRCPPRPSTGDSARLCPGRV